MDRNYKSDSPFTMWLIFVVVFASLAPIYHNHAYALDYQREDGVYNALFHDGSGHDALSPDHRHEGPHVHLKKDIGSAETYRHFKSKPLKTALCKINLSPVVANYMTSSRARQAQAPVFSSYARDSFSGLSPPAFPCC